MYLSDLWDLRSLTKRLYGQRIQPVCEAYSLTVWRWIFCCFGQQSGVRHGQGIL